MNKTNRCDSGEAGCGRSFNTSGRTTASYASTFRRSNALSTSTTLAVSTAADKHQRELLHLVPGKAEERRERDGRDKGRRKLEAKPRPHLEKLRDGLAEAQEVLLDGEEAVVLRVKTADRTGVEGVEKSRATMDLTAKNVFFSNVSLRNERSWAKRARATSRTSPSSGWV